LSSIVPARVVIAGLRALGLLLMSAAPARAQPAPAPPPATPFHRWIDWQAGALDSRYRQIHDSDGNKTTDQLQLRELARVRFKLDAPGRYFVEAFAHTGASFTSSWDPLGPGTGEPTWDLHVRQLFLSATPATGLELQFGGLGLTRGEQTEITSFDNDGFMTGGRVTIRRPAQLSADEITVTAGFVGDVSTPNVFRRFERLGDHNYTQALVMKRAGPRVRVSGDWTSLDGISTLREAIRVGTRGWLPVDGVRFETYQRLEGDEAAGFAVSAERTIASRLNVSGGYADIDRDYGRDTAADRFGPGRRLFAEARVPIGPAFSVTVYYGHGVANDFDVSNDRRMDIIASWNVVRTLWTR
jgi:hypothetical protein